MTKSVDYLLIVCILLAASLFGAYQWGHVNGADEVQVLWDADQAKLMQANGELIQQHAIEMQQEREKNLNLNRKTDYEHELALQKKDAALAAARADADRRGGLRVPVPACAASGGPATAAQAESTGQRDETAASTVELPARISDGLWAIIGRADAIVEQARSCQNWIRQNGFSDENPVDGIAPSQ